MVEGSTIRLARSSLSGLMLLVGVMSPELIPAQDEARTARTHSIRGVVRKADGTRVAGAIVHGVTRPLGPILDSGPTRHVRTVSDSRGRFKLKVTRGYDSSVWAIAVLPEASKAPADANPNAAYVTSEIVDGVRERQILRLTLRDEQRTPIHLAFSGLDAWKHRGPLQVYALDPAPRAMLRSRLVLDEGGRARMPRITSNGAWIEIDDKDGIPIFQALVHPDRNIATHKKPIAIQVAPPRTLRIRAFERAGTKADIAKPVRSGGTLYFGRNLSRHPLQRVGELDADGTFELEFAISEQSTDVVGLSRSNDLTDTVFVLSCENFSDAYANLGRTGGQKAKDGKYELRFGLTAGHTIRGRLMHNAERPVADAVLLHYASINGIRGGGQVACTPRRVPCDADGRFVLRGQNPKYPFRITWVPDERTRQSIGTEALPLAPEHLVAWMKVDEKRPKLDLGTIRVDELARVDIRGLATDGSPLRYPMFQIYENAKSSGGSNRPMTGRGNRRGAVRVLCPKASALGIWMSCAQGFADVIHDVDGDTELRLRLDAARRMTGQVFSIADGSAPLAHATLRLNRVGRSNDLAFRSRLQSARSLGGMTRQPYNPLRKITVLQIRRRVWSYFGGSEAPIRCDANGRFELFLPAHYAGMSLLSNGPENTKWSRGTAFKDVRPDKQ